MPSDIKEAERMLDLFNSVGARSIVVGLQPGVVSALVDMDVNTDGIEATLDLEEAFLMLRPEEPAAPEEEADADPEDEPEADDEGTP